MNKKTALKELSRLRNRHVAKLLNYLGETPPFLESAIKKSMSLFAEDIKNNIINSDHEDRKWKEDI